MLKGNIDTVKILSDEIATTVECKPKWKTAAAYEPSLGVANTTNDTRIFRAIIKLCRKRSIYADKRCPSISNIVKLKHCCSAVPYGKASCQMNQGDCFICMRCDAIVTKKIL